jgi:hypothetical protein
MARFVASLTELETICVMALSQSTLKNVHAVSVQSAHSEATPGDWEVVRIVPQPSLLELADAMATIRGIRQAFALRVVADSQVSAAST